MRDEVLALTFLELACDDASARFNERALVLHRAMRIWPLRNELRYTVPLDGQAPTTIFGQRLSVAEHSSRRAGKRSDAKK